MENSRCGGEVLHRDTDMIPAFAAVNTGHIV